MMLQLLKRVNAILLPIASRGVIGVWAVIHTTGRKSGKPYATPIAVEPFGDGFIIGLPYGEQVDWCRNVLAAGSATITWHGKDHAVSAPEIIDRAAADPAYSPPLRLALRLFRIKRFLRVRRQAAAA
jgi:deazaflavin-dependent oxidoreductase (nitroreductase family)